MRWVPLAALAASLVGCAGAEPASLQQTAFRVGFGVNADEGWAGELDQNVGVFVDRPFRLRFELEGPPGARETPLGLESRRNGGNWTPVSVSEFPKPEESSPRVSIVSATANPNSVVREGAFLSEWEWPLVIRRFADGAVTNEDGDVFEFRMTANGAAIDADIHPSLTVSIPENHLGGTFVETPGRIGPWQASNGDLYFIMEPVETDNLFMMVRSSDAGRTWQEADPENRPDANDLEGVASALAGDTIHILHQTSDQVWYHAFRTSDHAESPDTWAVGSELAAQPGEPPTQVASVAVRSDGVVVGVYGGPGKIHFRMRDSEGGWSEEVIVDPDTGPNLSGPQVVAGRDDDVHLAYTGADGTAWYRRIQADGGLTPRERLATGLGTSFGDVDSILPLVFLPDTSTVVVLYRLADGTLWERRVADNGTPAPPVQVSDRAVVQNAVDSDQTGADAIAEGETVHVVFVEEASGSIYHTWSGPNREWAPAALVVDGVRTQWIRGQTITDIDGTRVYGVAYDAGSDGGSGMNRFVRVPLD